jgi:hypothetical protein
MARGGVSRLRRQRIPIGWPLCIVLAALGVAAYSAYQSTRPYDPLAQGQAMSATAGGAKPGQTFTVIYPIITDSGERATILGATAVANGDTRLTALNGVSTAFGIEVANGRPRGVAADDRGRLRPLQGLRFTTADPKSANRAFLATHVWVAETVTVLRGRGCLDLPALRLRYRVGGTSFTRTLPAPVRLAGVGTDTSSCISPAF